MLLQRSIPCHTKRKRKKKLEAHPMYWTHTQKRVFRLPYIEFRREKNVTTANGIIRLIYVMCLCAMLFLWWTIFGKYFEQNEKKNLLLNWFECTKNRTAFVVVNEWYVSRRRWCFCRKRSFDVNAFRSLNLNYKPKQFQMKHGNWDRETEHKERWKNR